MTTFKTLLTTFGLLIASASAEAAHLQGHVQFSARLNGAQEVPAVITDAQGVASLTLNTTRDTLCIRGNFTGLSGGIMGAHIHDGMAGMNGPVLVDLTPFLSGNTLEAQLTGAAITPSIVAAHIRGALYLNIHTAANPNGEIRGQILPETDMALMADLDGMQEVPMVMTNGMGMATFLLAKYQGELKYHVVVNGLSGPIQAAHLHSGAMGTNGGVVLDLGPGIMGNTIMGSADPAPFLADLLTGNIYINVHTAQFPSGEIRGQVMAVQGLAFDAALDGVQEVPMVNTNGRGIASIRITADLDSIRYDVQLSGLSGPAQAAHLHLGAPGSNGPVTLDLSSGIMGDRIQGWALTSGLGDALITEMLEGGVYLNVHTAQEPAGEIRGQVYRYLREGYTLALDGMQEVPMNNSTASGGGIVSVDRDQSNAHIMYVTDASMVSATHLHLGVAGTNGPVVYDLSPALMNNGVFTYWTSMDGMTPFALQNSVQLRNDSIYVNVHTAAFPMGEVRGQVLRGSPCTMLSTGILDLGTKATRLQAYPVPAVDRVTVDLDAPWNGNAIGLYSALGSRIAMPVIQYQSDRLIIDIQELPTGAYILRLEDKDSVRTARFIKQ